MRNILKIAVALLALLVPVNMAGQELNATVEVNTSRIDGTNKAVFDNLKEAITTFLNERHWTNMQFNNNERIKCGFTIVLNKYNSDTGLTSGEGFISVQRPVYGSTYNTVTFSRKDKDFSFNYHEFDQLDFNDENVQNSLTALLAFYAYFIIGIDLDTMAPLGGTEILDKAMAVGC